MWLFIGYIVIALILCAAAWVVTEDKRKDENVYRSWEARWAREHNYDLTAFVIIGSILWPLSLTVVIVWGLFTLLLYLFRSIKDGFASSVESTQKNT